MPPLGASVSGRTPGATQGGFVHLGAGGFVRTNVQPITGALTISTSNSANVMRAIPFTSPRGGQISQLLATVTGAAASNLQLGVYDSVSQTDLRPNALLHSSGLISTTPSGSKTSVITPALSLNPNRLYYLVALVGPTAVTLLSSSNISAWVLLGFNAILASGSAGYGWQAPFTGINPLPAFFPAGGLNTLGTSPLPLVGVRFVS